MNEGDKAVFWVILFIYAIIFTLTFFEKVRLCVVNFMVNL